MLVHYYQLEIREGRKFGYIMPCADDIYAERYTRELEEGLIPEVRMPEGYEFGDLYHHPSLMYIVSERLKKVLESYSNPNLVAYLPVKLKAEEIDQEMMYFRVLFKHVPGVLSEHSLGYKSPYYCHVPAFINKEVAKCGNVFTCGAVWRGGIYVTEEVYKALKDAKINKNIHYIQRGGIDEGDKVRWEGE